MTAGRVLVTRPEPGCSRTARRVAALGLEPVRLPVTEARHDPGTVRDAVGRSWGALAVTSANAVRVLETVPEAVAAWGDLPLFAVGARTAGLARQAGFARAEQGGGSGRDLAARIAAAGGPRADAPLLYCAGRPRSDGLERALRAAGVPFSVAECYRMEPLAYPDAALAELLAVPLAAALFYSRETAAAFFRLLSAAGLMDRFRPDRIVCLSDGVTAGLPEKLRPLSAAPRRPSEEAVLEILAAMRK